MPTDLDRLHAVVSGELEGRRIGKTFAQCHAVASVIELGETEVMVAMPRYDWFNHVSPMLADILVERGLGVPVRRSQWEWQLPSGAVIRFAGSDAEQRLLGSHATMIGIWE